MKDKEAPEIFSPEDRPRLTADEIAGLMEALPPQEILAELGTLHPDDAAEILSRLPEGTLKDLKPDQQLLDVVEELEDNDQADVVARLSTDTREYLLEELSEGDTVEHLLSYDPETAGGLMTTNIVTVRAGTTGGEAIQQIRKHDAAEGTLIYNVYVIDNEHRLKGVLPLGRLVPMNPSHPVDQVMDPSEATVPPEMDQEQVARTMARFNVTAIPVVNAKGVLLGAITFDDVIDVVEAEQTEDLLKFGGMEALDEPYTQIGLGRMIQKRAGWLLILFCSEMLTATAMGHFDKEIQRAVVLALFIPLIISSGGNSGSQATSLIIRAMALGEVTLKDWWRVAIREIPSGVSLGAILGVVGFLRISLWQALGWYNYGEHHVRIAFAVGGSLIGVVLFGGLAGSMLPFILKRFGFDPASASAPFVATLVDVTGIVIYFSVAGLILGGTLL